MAKKSKAVLKAEEAAEIERIRRDAKIAAWTAYTAVATRGVSGAFSLGVGGLGIVDPTLLSPFLQTHSLHALGIGVTLLGGPKIVAFAKKVLDAL